jgi:hypothetical protein
MKIAKLQMKKLKQEAKEVGNLLAKYQKAQEELKNQKHHVQEKEGMILQVRRRIWKIAEEKILLRIVIPS